LNGWPVLIWDPVSALGNVTSGIGLIYLLRAGSISMTTLWIDFIIYAAWASALHAVYTVFLRAYGSLVIKENRQHKSLFYNIHSSES
jgi:hypothetical protein